MELPDFNLITLSDYVCGGNYLGIGATAVVAEHSVWNHQVVVYTLEPDKVTLLEHYGLALDVYEEPIVYEGSRGVPTEAVLYHVDCPKLVSGDTAPPHIQRRIRAIFRYMHKISWRSTSDIEKDIVFESSVNKAILTHFRARDVVVVDMEDNMLWNVLWDPDHDMLYFHDCFHTKRKHPGPNALQIILDYEETMEKHLEKQTASDELYCNAF